MIRKISKLLIIIIFNPVALFACRCQEPGTIYEAYEKTQIVVYGKVLKKDFISYGETIRESEAKQIEKELEGNINQRLFLTGKSVNKITLKVLKNYKQENLADTIIIFTPISGASCGYSRFREDEEYIVYGFSSMQYYFLRSETARKGNIGKENSYWTNHCTRTKIAYQYELDELDRIKNCEFNQEVYNQVLKKLLIFTDVLNELEDTIKVSLDFELLDKEEMREWKLKKFNNLFILDKEKGQKGIIFKNYKQNEDFYVVEFQVITKNNKYLGSMNFYCDRGELQGKDIQYKRIMD